MRKNSEFGAFANAFKLAMIIIAKKYWNDIYVNISLILNPLLKRMIGIKTSIIVLAKKVIKLETLIFICYN